MKALQILGLLIGCLSGVTPRPGLAQSPIDFANPGLAPVATDIVYLEDQSQRRRWPVKTYRPQRHDLARAIVLSSGLGRDYDDLELLAQHWASWGFTVVSVQHPGSDVDALRNPRTPNGWAMPITPGQRDEAQGPFQRVQRTQDLRNTLALLPQIFKHANLDSRRQGVVGLDAGADAALALVGMRLLGAPTTSWKEPSVHAAMVFDHRWQASHSDTDIRRAAAHDFAEVSTPLFIAYHTPISDPSLESAIAHSAALLAPAHGLRHALVLSEKRATKRPSVNALPRRWQTRSDLGEPPYRALLARTTAFWLATLTPTHAWAEPAQAQLEESLKANERIIPTSDNSLGGRLDWRTLGTPLPSQ